MAKSENNEAHTVEDVEATRKQLTGGDEKPAKGKVETRPASKAGVETR